MDDTKIVAGFTIALAGVALVAAKGLRELVSAWFDRMVKRIQNPNRSHLKGLLGIRALAESTERMAAFEFVKRALVFVGTNCGGVPTLTKPYTVRCLTGYPKEARNLYNFTFTVDAAYVNMLIELLEKGSIEVVTANMDKTCQLYGYYAREKVVSAVMYSIYCEDTLFVFESIASYERQFTQDERTLISIEVDRLRAAYKEFA